jgi:alcohol dehydrogenase class IV
VLGGRFDLPHAAMHAIVLPYVVAFNAPAAPDAAARIAGALGSIDALAGLEDLRDDLDAPRALRDIGLRAEDLPEAVDAVLPAVPANNPRPVDAAALTRLLRAAWAGDDPGGLA